MTIEVLGSGCPTCKKLYELVLEAVSELESSGTLGDSVEVAYLTGQEGLARMIDLGALSSPVLAVDGQIVTGFEFSVASINQALSARL